MELCNINKLNIIFDNFVLDSFEFESGRILENVNVAYSTEGTPKYDDDDGNIVNAIIYSATLYGWDSILAKNNELLREYNHNDNYFFIRIYSLGVPNSCSPSTTGLKYNFPEYTFRDRVNFKRQFLKEKFGIKNVFGLVGEGIGGYEVFTWACEYPDEMDFIITLNSSYKTSSYRYIFTNFMDSLIDSSDDFYSEGYSASFTKLSVAIYKFLFAGYFTEKVIENLSNDEIDVLMDDFVENGLFMDIHDFKSRNDCLLEYSVEDKLENIKAKSLIFGVKGYLFFNYKDLLSLDNFIESSKVVLFESKRENYYDDEDYSELISEVVSFLKQFKK